MAENLKVQIGRLTLRNPVMAASGTFGHEIAELVDMNALGAIVLKTITLKACAGNCPPRVIETAAGMLNSIGLENRGLEAFLSGILPKFKDAAARIFVSIAGDTEKEFVAMAKALSAAGRVDGLELNLSCPNVRHGSLKGLIAQDDRAVYNIVSRVRKATPLTLIAKLSPQVTDIAPLVKAAEDAGADGVALVNTYPGLAVDITTGRPRLGNVTGGLSGPAIKPLALKIVWDAYRAIRIPIIGIGGIVDYRDAVEFLLCGARAVQVGTATFINPRAAVEIIAGLKRYMKQRRIGSITEVVGAMKITERDADET